MHPYHIQNILTITVLFITAIAGIFRIRIMDKAARFLFLLVVMALVTEVTAYYAGIKYHNNMPVYNAFSVIEIVLVSIYFNYTIRTFKKYWIGFAIAALALITGIIYHVFIHPATFTNSHFLIGEGLLIITFSLIYILQSMARYNNEPIRKDVHFWIAITFLFFWTPTLLNWISYDYLTSSMAEDKWIIDRMIFFISLLANIAFAVLFFLYPKMKDLHEPA